MRQIMEGPAGVEYNDPWVSDPPDIRDFMNSTRDNAALMPTLKFRPESNTKLQFVGDVVGGSLSLTPDVTPDDETTTSPALPPSSSLPSATSNPIKVIGKHYITADGLRDKGSMLLVTITKGAVGIKSNRATIYGQYLFGPKSGVPIPNLADPNLPFHSDDSSGTGGGLGGVAKKYSLKHQLYNGEIASKQTTSAFLPKIRSALTKAYKDSSSVQMSEADPLFMDKNLTIDPKAQGLRTLVINTWLEPYQTSSSTVNSYKLFNTIDGILDRTGENFKYNNNDTHTETNTVLGIGN